MEPIKISCDEADHITIEFEIMDEGILIMIGDNDQWDDSTMGVFLSAEKTKELGEHLIKLSRTLIHSRKSD